MKTIDITSVVKLASVVVLFVAVIGAIVLAGVFLLKGQPIPSVVAAIAGYGIAQALALLGIHLASNGKTNGNGNGNGKTAGPTDATTH